MKTTPHRTKKYLSRKGRVPLPIEITPEIKAKLLHIAEEKGMSFNRAAAEMLRDGLIRQAILEQMTPYIEERVKEAMEREFSKQATPVLEAFSKTEKIYRVLKRILINPAEKIEAVEREIEEEAIN